MVTPSKYSELPHLNTIIKQLAEHRTNEARPVLERMLNTPNPPVSRPTLRALLGLCRHHSAKVFTLSLPAALVCFTPAFACLAALKFWIAAKWKPEAVEFVSFLDILVPSTTYLALRWARRKWPTCCKPEMPWLILGMASVALSLLLLAAAYFTLVLLSRITSASLPITQLGATLADILAPAVLLQGAFNLALSHPLTAIATLLTTALGYYGPVSKTTAQALELYNNLGDS